MSFQILFGDSASSSIKALDTATARRVLTRLHWFSENFEQIKPIPLTGKYAGLFKFRIGEYRVIYSIVYDEQVVNVLYFGHRRDIYK